MSETQGLTEDEVDILVSSAVSAPSSGRLNGIGLGAATFNVRVAAAMLGHETTLAIDPDPARPDIVARVFLGQRQGLVELGRLYGELRRRHTYRGPMMETPRRSWRESLTRSP
jgi:hypothetical protein